MVDLVMLKAPFSKLNLLILFSFLIFENCSKSDNAELDDANQEEQVQITPLKEKASTFLVGAATNAQRLTSGNDYDKMFKSEFGSITAEYQMKMNVILPEKGSYNWSHSDKIVEYAMDNDLNIHGHALVWHNSTPDWLVNYQGTDQEFEQEVKDYITAVVTRYKGKISSWDVVNEGVNDSGGTLRNTVFKQRMGDDYMAKCFQFARDADPDALLFYNDYNMTSNISKQDKVFELIADWKNRNVPIDGVGYQMHIRYNWPSNVHIQTATNRAVSNNLILHFSELDIRVNPNEDITYLTEERANAQKQKFKDVVRIYNTIPDQNKYGITLWGIKDDDSWLLSHHNNNNEWPLLFDSDFKAKKAHAGFLEGLE